MRTRNKNAVPTRCIVPDYDNIVTYNTLDRTNIVRDVGFIIGTYSFNHTGGTTEVRDILIQGPQGVCIPGTLTVQHVSGTAGGSINFNNGGISHLNAADYIITVDIDCDYSPGWQLYATSVGGGEAKGFFASNPVTAYDQGPGGIALTLPYTGGWNNNNNQNASGFGFDPSNTFTFRTNGQNNLSSGMRLYIDRGPDPVSTDTCDAIKDHSLRIKKIENDDPSAAPVVSSVTQDLAADTVTHDAGDGSAPTVLDFSKYNQQTITMEWEEGAGLADGSFQWSVGNGATGNTSQVVPIDVTLRRATFHAETAGTSVTIELRNNGGALLETFTFTGQSDVFVLPTPLNISQGTAISINTGVETGTYADARVSLFMTYEGSL